MKGIRSVTTTMQDSLTARERVPLRIFESSKNASRAVAHRIAELIKQRQSDGKACVLGLATGSTPINVYQELIRLHKEEGLDFGNVVTFNLDEYWQVPADAIQSYWMWMHENFFNYVNIPAENIHIPLGMVAEDDIDDHCDAYEQAIIAAGGIDFQLLGIGRSGHIGFNEPGSGEDSRTRRIHLDKITRMDAASDFFGEENVPEMAITMGVGTILDAREVALLAFGEHKAPIIKEAVEGEISLEVAASFLQEHANATFYLDSAAADCLTRIATPWLAGPCEWDDLLERLAVIWLAGKLDKPILKLTDEDYGEHGLSEMMRARGKAYDVNLRVFKYMVHTITGWPGGKEGPKRVLILSPHPDDDVICMGGTMRRLCEQGHDVHVAYMVSGSLSVFDHNVIRYTEFMREFHHSFDIDRDKSIHIEDEIDAFLETKSTGEVDCDAVQTIKGLIRRCEAINAARLCHVPDENMHFMDMPFYQTGKVHKDPIGPDDVGCVRDALEAIKPDIVFAAGDMSDPHGTHRMCLEAAMIALNDYEQAGNPAPRLLLYRGAWQEWPAAQADMASPLSPDEQRHKRFAIFRHESQKDRAMFPGPYDSREFWQRAEDRNIETARVYDALGLPEYHGVEAFVEYPLEKPPAITCQFE
jgi:glucosamine-6-phosphate deaminase